MKYLRSKKLSKSHVITKGAYDPATKTMTILFRSGALYAYADVSPEDFAAFEAADSPGGHFTTHIRPKYKGQRVSA
jgi:hypothetical protein